MVRSYDLKIFTRLSCHQEISINIMNIRFLFYCIDSVTPLFLPPPDLSFCFLCNQAIYGQGIERHMLGLKMVAIEDLTSLPEIFMDTSFAVASHFNLHTSQVCKLRS